jgi:uncharacterized protein
MPDDGADDGAQAFEPRVSPRPNRAGEIAWRPFGPDAFEEARRLSRPILLSIGAVWCHWCHVMDETSYSDRRVLAALSDRYVCVRADRDQRPDVDRRYNQGGWPTTCLLNSSGSVLWGGTYVPPEPFADVLERVAEAYARDPALADALPPRSAGGGGAAAAGPSAGGPEGIVDDLLAALGRMEDRQHGGFGHEGPKFPQVEALGFLAALAPWPGRRGEAAQAILGRALDGMLQGELEDRVEGGFYRYATRPDWREPHYEKMLVDNAALASLYLRAGARTGEPAWLRAGRDAMAFLDSVLWQEALGAYAMSQDADEAYAALDARARGARPAPFVDAVLYADANLKMVETLLDAWAVLGEERYRERALALWDGLVRRLYRPGAGFAHYDAGNGAAPLCEVLDQVEGLGAACALLPFGRAEDARLARALADGLVDGGAQSGVLRPASGAWAGPASWQGAPEAPLVQESGRAARHLLALGRRLGEARYDAAARRLVERFAPDVAALGTFAAEIGWAAASFRPEVTVSIALAPAARDAEAHSFLAAARRSAIEPLRASLATADERAALGLGAAGETLAYPCLGGTCSAPAGRPSELSDSLRRLVAQAPWQLVW